MTRLEAVMSVLTNDDEVAAAIVIELAMEVTITQRDDYYYAQNKQGAVASGATPDAALMRLINTHGVQHSCKVVMR